MNKSIISYSLLTVSLITFSFVHIKADMDMYGTHMACLIAAVSNTTGPVLELGSGHYSTPLLHAICAPYKDKPARLLVSTETEFNWLNKFKKRYERPWHQFVHIPSPDAWYSIGKDINWDVVLVDQEPTYMRVKMIEYLKPVTKIFVVHDTEDPNYHYEPVLQTFKYRYNFKRYKVHATLVSDTVDVREFFK